MDDDAVKRPVLKRYSVVLATVASTAIGAVMAPLLNAIDSDNLSFRNALVKEGKSAALIGGIIGAGVGLIGTMVNNHMVEATRPYVEKVEQERDALRQAQNKTVRE